jgi:hypothetical protein
MVFTLASKVINLILSHPMTIQYPVNLIEEIASADGADIEVVRIP